MDTFHSLGQVVRTESMKLWVHVDVGNACQFVPFEKRILWLRESSTILRLVHDDVEVDESLKQFSDHYGFLTSLEHSIVDGEWGASDASKWASKYDLNIC